MAGTSLIESLRRDRLGRAGQRCLERVPGEARALHAGGELAHARERRELSQAGRRFLVAGHGGDRAVEAREQLVRLGGGLALHRLGQERRRGGRDGAALAGEARVAHAVSVDLEHEHELVAAERIAPTGAVRGVRQRPEVPRVLGVVQDHLLVEVSQVGHQPKISSTRRTPAARRSTSVRVLCTANDARAVAGTSKCSITGCAQWCPARIATPSPSRIVPTSWAWTSPTTNEITPARSRGVPIRRTPGISPRRWVA